MIPLRAGYLAAFPHKPRLEQDRKGQVDVVAAQQNMFADGNPRDVGDAARRTGSQLEQAEIRSAAADIDDQNVPRLGIMCVESLPQRVGRAVAVAASNRTPPAAPRAAARCSGNPASSAAFRVSRWAAASNEAGTVMVISWSSNAQPDPAKLLSHAPRR